MEKNRMKVLVFEPGQEPHVEIINKNESAYRELVGGPITAKPLDDNTVIVYNDIKSEENARLNRWVGGAIISGTFFLASSEDGEKLSDIKPYQMQYYNAVYGKPHEISKEEYSTHISLSDKDCDAEYISNYTDKLEHKYTATVTEPTCLNLGYTTFECADCHDTYKAEYKEALGHTPSEWIVDIEATINNAGEKHIECTVCGERLMTAAITQLVGRDFSDEDGNAVVGAYSIRLSDKNDMPVWNAEITIDVNDNVLIKLPDGRLLDFADQTTIEVKKTDTGEAKEGLAILTIDKNGNNATGKTNAEGILKVPNDKSSTGDDNGTIGNGDDEIKNTHVVTVTDKANVIIPNCDIRIGESNNIVVDLPDGIKPTSEKPVIVTVVDQNGDAKRGVTVMAMGDADFIEKSATTNSNGQITVPVKTSSGGSSSGGSSGGGGGGGYSVSTVNVKVVDKDGKTVTVSKSTGTDKVTLTLTTGKNLAKDDNYYTITVTDRTVKAKADYEVVLKDGNKNEVTGKTNKDGILILPAEEHKAYIVGYDDGTFRPDSDMTRAEAAAIFARLIAEDKGETVSGKNTFADVNKNAWYYDYVGYLAKYDIINGYTDGTFKPDESVTRAEFVAMAVRYYGLFNEVKNTGYTVKYTDLDKNYWAYNDIALAKNIGWLNGYADGTFRGDNNITRAEVVTIVNRATGRTADKEYVKDNLTKLNRFTDVTNSNLWYFMDVHEAANTHMANAGNDAETWVK